MSFSVTILGSSSATPTLTRNPSAQVLHVNGTPYLIDCGEGAQVQLMRFGIRTHKIPCIFISHLHPDHYLGLLGLICTMNLQGRTSPLIIFSPEGLEQLVEQMFVLSNFHLQYPIEFRILKCIEPEVIFETADLLVETLILSHRVPTTGFVFREKELPPKIKAEECERAGLPFDAYKAFKARRNFIDKKGREYSYPDFTLPPPLPHSYAYLSDTAYMPENIKLVENVRMIYHEATFMEQHIERARETFHSTAAQAAEFALKAGAEKLLIGHFSTRYKDLQPLLEEAKAIFPNTFLAVDGESFGL